MSGSFLWLLLPIFAAVFYSISGVLQNYIVDMAMPKKRAGSFLATHIITFVMGMLVVLAIFGRSVFMLPLANAFGLMLAGAINTVASAFYYKSLQSGDTVDVSIYNQVGPILSLVLGFLILGQDITLNQGISFILIMIAALFIVFSGVDKKSRKGKAPDVKTACLTLTYTVFSAVSDIVFVYYLQGTKDYTLFAQSFFYFELGSCLATVMALILFESWREALKRAFKTSKNHRINNLAMWADNIVSTIAELFQKLGLIIAPIVALFTVVSRIANLVMGFVLALVLGRAFPKFIHAKKMTQKVIYSYIFAGVLIMAGIVLMNI